MPIPVEGTQHSYYFAMQHTAVKPFMLLRNIHFVFELMRKTIPKFKVGF